MSGRQIMISTLLVLVILGAACNKGSKAIAKGATFSVPVPDGYRVATDPRLTKGAPGGVVLMAKKRVAEGIFLGSIVVTRVPQGKDFDVKKLEVCQEIAEQFAKAAPVKLKRAELVETAAGKTCQYEVADRTRAHRSATGTVMYKTRDNCWVLTCNFDERDPGAREACDEALGEWKFD